MISNIKLIPRASEKLFAQLHLQMRHYKSGSHHLWCGRELFHD